LRVMMRLAGSRTGVRANERPGERSFALSFGPSET
jgi:hypothetical protein